MQIGQRVVTKLGAGIVVGFERVTNFSVENLKTFQEGDRIAIKLDVPENWLLHSKDSGYPYFYESEVSPE